MHLLLGVLLQVELLFKLVKLRPKLPFVVFNVLAIVLEFFNLSQLLLLFSSNLFQFLVQLSQFFLQQLSFFGFLGSLDPLQLRSFQLQVLLKLLQLLAIRGPLFFFLHYLVI